MNCLIVEDNPATREFILDVIKDNFSEISCFSAGDLGEAENLFVKIHPELLVMDVNLPDGKSVDFLSKLCNQISAVHFKVIFITAFSDYAIDAIRLSAMDFLLKPISPVELIGAVNKSIDSLKKDVRYTELETFFYNLGQNQSAMGEKKIVLKTAENAHVLSIKQIYYASADNNYTAFILDYGEPLIVSQPLKYYDEKLGFLGFLRVHQSYLVNMDHVSLYDKRKESVLLTNGSQIPVSQSKKSTIMKFLNKQYL
ncbi:LytR/AlgR family response regulator transcription factor [Algoriphagus sp.]|uniref:LytR/AlgR family response regulator transcription factor n=1 Tax=Algoriphagus sp. TaxID=1872435 RepID=UPI003F6FA14C